jgi:hypothetical protein
MNIEPCCDWCGKAYEETGSIHPRPEQAGKWLCGACHPKDLPHTFNPEKLSLASQEFLGIIAERAGDALCNYTEVSNPDDHNVSGLISDLGHLCDREGHDFRSLIHTGVQQWEQER